MRISDWSSDVCSSDLWNEGVRTAELSLPFMVLGRLGNRETVMAEREGFEPSIRLPVCRISSAVHSTTLPPLRQKVAKRLVLIMPRVDRKSTRLYSSTNAHLVCSLLLEKKIDKTHNKS